MTTVAISFFFCKWAHEISCEPLHMYIHMSYIYVLVCIDFYTTFSGGWVTASNITATVEPNKRSLVVICHGLNMQLTENVVSTHTVNILCEYYTYIYQLYITHLRY